MTFVFIGDSITDCDRRTDPLGLGSGYVDMIATELGTAARVVNTGISGDRVAHLAERWAADALAHDPSTLTIYVGVNDTLVTFFQGRPTPPAEFEASYRSILERSAGVHRLIVIEPFFLPSTADYVPWREGAAFVAADLDRKRPIVRALAAEFGATFVPLQEPFEELAARRGIPAVAGDGVHPSPLGHRLIASLWLAAHEGESP
jgi:acyl-CoA thioesterase-1